MRWVFLAVIVLSVFLLNAAVIGASSDWLALGYGLAGVNVFLAGLVGVWLAAYYRSFAVRGYGILGHAAVYFSAGIGFVGFGHVGLAQRACVFPQMSVAQWAAEHDLCGALSGVAIAFGLFTLWPALRLFLRIGRH